MALFLTGPRFPATLRDSAAIYQMKRRKHEEAWNPVSSQPHSLLDALLAAGSGPDDHSASSGAHAGVPAAGAVKVGAFGLCASLSHPGAQRSGPPAPARRWIAYGG